MGRARRQRCVRNIKRVLIIAISNVGFWALESSIFLYKPPKPGNLFLAVYLTTLIQASMGSRMSSPHHAIRPHRTTTWFSGNVAH